MKEDKFLGAHYGILHIKEGLCLTTYIYINISNIDQKYNLYMYIVKRFISRDFGCKHGHLLNSYYLTNYDS